MASTEDCIANKVLQEYSQDIVDNIDVDSVIFRLHSKSWLTIEEITRLENISTLQEKRRQLYIFALAGKGFAAFKDVVGILKETASSHKAHAELADKLSNRYGLLSQHTNESGSRSQGDKAKARTEASIDDSDSRHSESPDVDHFSCLDHDDQSQLLPPDGQTNVEQTNYQACAYKRSVSDIDMRPGHGRLASSSTTHTCRSSMGSSMRVARQLSSSFQANDQVPSSMKTHASECRPVGATRRKYQSETSDFGDSSVFEESRFSDSITTSKSTILLKSTSILPDMIKIKLILIGDSKVGKTSLAQRFLNGSYDDNPPRTVGDAHDKCYYKHTQKGVNIKLSIWDGAGEEQFTSMSPMFYRDAHVAVVVFDMAELSSLLSVNNWKTGVHRYISNETPVLLVGNKCEIPEGTNEIRRRVQGMADNFNGFIEVSAKLDYNVERIFEEAVLLALENYTPPTDTAISLCQSQQQQQRHQQQQKSSCC